MITLMKEITNAKVFLTHRLLTFPLHILCCASSRTFLRSSYTVAIGGLGVKK